MVRHAAGEDGHIEMRRLRPGIGTGHPAGLNRLDPESAGFIRADAGEAVEISFSAVGRMGIAALGVRLPDLDKAVDHGSARAIDDLAGHDDALAGDGVADDATVRNANPAIG